MRTNHVPFNLGFTLLKELGLDESEYRDKIIKERLLTALARIYWDAIVGHAGTKGLSVNDIARKIGRDLGTANRWTNEKNLPGLEVFCGTTVIALREEFGAIKFPDLPSVRWRTAARILGVIRQEECRRERRTPLPDEFNLVWIFARHPGVDEAITNLRNTGKPIDSSLIASVMKKMNLLRPDHGIRSSLAACRVISDWIEPYALFQVGLKAGWEDFDELAD